MSDDVKPPDPPIVTRGRVERATYRDPEIPDYRGNPLIEALPPILSADEATERLADFPAYDEQFRHVADHLRFHHIQSGLRFFSPLPIHTDLERRFSCLIRQGLVARNPAATWFWKDVDSRVSAVALSEPSREVAWMPASGFTIVGMSGMGKSRSAQEVLNLNPQVIHHSQYRSRDFTHTQLVWLKLECPHDGSIKGLCLDFFLAVDNILGTSYRKTYAAGRRTVDELRVSMALVAAVHGLGVLVIDEIQRLSPFKSGGPTRMVDFFVQLVNTVGVPVVLIGTYKAISVLSGEFRLVRRGTGQGDLVWDRMRENKVWTLFVESLWKYQYTRTACPLTEVLSRVLYEETQGITDLVVKLYMLAQVRAIVTGIERVTPAILRSVAKDNLRLARPILDAMRAGDMRVLQTYDDLDPLDFLCAVEVEGAPGRDAVDAAQPETQEGEATPPEDDASVAESAAAPQRPSKQRTSRRTAPHPDTGDSLPAVVARSAKAGLAAYEALRDADHIRPAVTYVEPGQ